MGIALVEPNVWIQQFVQAVTYASNLFGLLKNQNMENSGGVSFAVQEKDAAIISTSKNTKGLVIDRISETKDGVFGRMSYDREFVCFSIENKDKTIPSGIYNAKLDFSPRLGYICPHIAVPERDKAASGDAGIRIHILNTPCESEGCIGPGLEIDGDAVDNSKTAFDLLMSKLPLSFTVTVISSFQG